MLNSTIDLDLCLYYKLMKIFRDIQRITKMWRIYVDNEEDRLILLTQGIVLRDKTIMPQQYNPRNPV